MIPRVTTTLLDDVRDLRLQRPDGRTVAWTEYGDPDGRPVVRVPGTPGCRYSLRADRTAWSSRGLRVLTTERPGFGASSRLPGRGFVEPADDIAAILDHCDIESAYVIGGSGSSPYQLAFAAGHPDRVRAMTILVGTAPSTDEEFEQQVGVNAEAHRLVAAGDVDGLRALLTAQREALLADPVAAIVAIMDRAPDADRAVMSDPRWQESFVVAMREALRPGVEGWLDEGLAVDTRWDEVDLDAVKTSVTWWHAPGDANCNLSAAERLVAQLPNARLVLFGAEEGHLAPYRRETEILDELLGRG
jgi:pimeloyl-ACP methyl ester carboxylesterase